MEEQNMREESLREELLELIIGAGGVQSASNNSIPGSFLDCVECQLRAKSYKGSIYWRDRHQAAIDQAVTGGDTAGADFWLQKSDEYHQLAQQEYGNMEAHGHPDFPSALRQQRLNYNPRN